MTSRVARWFVRMRDILSAELTDNSCVPVHLVVRRCVEFVIECGHSVNLTNPAPVNEAIEGFLARHHLV